MPTVSSNVRFSNRPFGVKRFQTIHHHSVDVAHGLVLLFGIGTKALPVWDSKTRRNNLSDYPPPQCRCRSRARASLRNRHQGPSSMGFEDEAEQSFGRPCRQSTAEPSRHANSPHPSSREGHLPLLGGARVFLLSRLILHGPYAAVTSRVHRNSVPSTQMRCMITANRRASATIAFFIPRCLAIFMAQALSQDQFALRTIMIWAAS